MCENRIPTFGSSRLVMFLWFHPVQTQPRKINISRTLLRRHLKNWSQAPGFPGFPGTRRLIPAPGLSGSQRAQDAKRTTQTSESHHPTDALVRSDRSHWMIKWSTTWASNLQWKYSVVSHRKTRWRTGWLWGITIPARSKEMLQVEHGARGLPEARLGSVWKVWRNPPNFRGSVHHAPVKRCS